MKTIGPDPLYAALRDELEMGESLRWWGRPTSKGGVVWAAFAIWIFAVPWTAFSLFWTYMAFAGVESMPGEGIFTILKYAFPAFGLPFIAVGVGMLGAPFMAGRAGSNAIYGITNRRIIRLIKFKKATKVDSISARQIGPVTRREAKNGVGKVAIQTHSRTDSEGDRQTATFDLLGVEDAKRVEWLVRELGRSADATEVEHGHAHAA